jgi:type III secretion system low calcium response chaperone LcrH/SycD
MSNAKKEPTKNEKLIEEQVAKFDQAFKEISDKMIKQGLPAKEAIGANSEVLESLYAQAYHLYNTGKYPEAIHLFRILIMMDSTEAKYLLGLAACFHMLKEYENALHTYTLCSALEPHNPISYYHASDCAVHLQDPITAKILLEMAIKHMGEQPQYSKMKERALMSLESLKQEQSR